MQQKLNVKKFKSFFTSGGFAYNDFANHSVGYDVLPDLWKHMDRFIPSGMTSQFLSTNHRSHFEIAPGHVELQIHDRSIEEHTDSIKQSEYFQLVVVSTRMKGKPCGYTTKPVMNFYDETGQKRKAVLMSGKSIVFNPRKPHSVIYYGEEYGVAIRTVRKIKNDKKIFGMG